MNDVQNIKDEIRNIDWMNITNTIKNNIKDYVSNKLLIIILCLISGYFIILSILKKGIKFNFEIHDNINKKTVLQKNEQEKSITNNLIMKKIENMEKNIKKIGVEQNQIMLQLNWLEKFMKKNE